MKGFYIEPQPDGSVRYRLAYCDPVTGKTKRLSLSMPSDTVRNRRKAESELMERAQAASSAPCDSTLQQAVDAYLLEKGHIWRESTALRNKRNMTVMLRKLPPDAFIDKLTIAYWKKALNELSGGQTGTYNEYVRRVKPFLRWCEQNEYITGNVSAKLAPIKKGKSELCDPTDKYLEKDEADALLAALGLHQNARWLQLARFMLLSGLRFGEAVALEDADVSARYIHVDKTFFDGTKKVGPPKTKKSNRDVSITPELASLIAEIREYNEWVKTSLGLITPLFFFSEKAEHLSLNAFDFALKTRATESIGHPVTSHWLRHTHASFLLAAGVPIDVISRRLGHDTTQITEKVYLHVIQSLREKDADRLDAITLLGSGSGDAKIKKIN